MSSAILSIATIEFVGFTAISMIYLYVFIRHKHESIYQKRGLPLVYTTLVFGIISVYLQILTITLDSIFSSNDLFITYTVIVMTMMVYYILYIPRLIYQFVNIRRSQNLSEWQKHLDPLCVINSNNSKILKYYHIFGNPRKINIIFIIIGAIMASICAFAGIIPYLILGYGNNTLTILIVLIVGSIIFSVICIVLFYLSFTGVFRFIDFWKIHFEYKLCTAILLLDCVPYLAIMFIFLPEFNTLILIGHVISITNIMLWNTISACLPYIVTYVVFFYVQTIN